MWDCIGQPDCHATPHLRETIARSEARVRELSMNSPSSYPYPVGSKITARQAVEFIADVVYPHEAQQISRKRVRDRIRYAKDIKRLADTHSFDAVQFFDWALSIGAWHDALMSVAGLPRSTRIEAQAGIVPVTGARAQITSIPADPEKLSGEYTRLVKLCQDQVSEIENLKHHVAELEAEIGQWREKDMAMREQRSRAGKRGGRGKNS